MIFLVFNNVQSHIEYAWKHIKKITPESTHATKLGILFLKPVYLLSDANFLIEESLPHHSGGPPSLMHKIRYLSYCVMFTLLRQKVVLVYGKLMKCYFCTKLKFGSVSNDLLPTLHPVLQYCHPVKSIHSMHKLMHMVDKYTILVAIIHCFLSYQGLLFVRNITDTTLAVLAGKVLLTLKNILVQKAFDLTINLRQLPVSENSSPQRVVSLFMLLFAKSRDITQRLVSDNTSIFNKIVVRSSAFIRLST